MTNVLLCASVVILLYFIFKTSKSHDEYYEYSDDCNKAVEATIEIINETSDV